MSTDQVNDLPIVGSEPSRSWAPFWTYVGLVLVGSMVSLVFFPILRVIPVRPASRGYILLYATLTNGLYSTLAIFYAFSFTMPWLWFRNAWARVLLAFIVPMMQWTCFILGIAFPDGVSFVSYTGTYVYFVTALLFGSIPSISFRWWRKWQLTAVGEKQADSRMTIVDLFGLSLVASLILTVVRIANQSSQIIFVWGEAWLGLAISALFGVMGTVIALTSISIYLHSRIRLTLANALGIGLAVLLMVSTSVLLDLGGGVYYPNPLLDVLMIALVALVYMVGTASGIALLLRKSGLRLSTRSDRQSSGQ